MKNLVSLVFAVMLSITAHAQVATLVQPSTVRQTSPISIVVTGSGFVTGATVQWNGADLPTQFVNSGKLIATLTSNHFADTGVRKVTVKNPSGTVSTAINFSVSAIPNIGSISVSPAVSTVAAGTTQQYSAVITCAWYGCPVTRT